MKKIILISDTHAVKDASDRIKAAYPMADYLIHCGDSLLPEFKLDSFIAVKGNVDEYSDLPQTKIIEVEEHRILVIHGNTLFPGRDPDYKAVSKEGKANNCDVVFFGHSHTYYDGTVDGVRLLNPGSIWKNRDESPASYMEVTIDNGVIHAERRQYLDVILGKV